MDARPTWDRIALGFALLFPTAITWVYFEVLKDADSSWQQLAYSIGKVLQFSFPVIWVFLFYRHRLAELNPRHLLAGSHASQNPKDDPTAPQWQRLGSLPSSILFSVVVVASMWLIYLLFLQGTSVGDQLQQQVIAKINQLGIATNIKFLAVGCFYALCHSFLEEYYWRWFVYRLAQTTWPTLASNLISSLGFALHHVILLAFFLGWSSPYTWLIAFAIALGGFVWAWQYELSGRLSRPWIGHMIVDAGIFALGYYLAGPF